MKWILSNGKSVWKNDSKYRIDWDKKSLSKEQFMLKQFLKQFWQNYIVFEEYPLPKTLLKVDILCTTKKIAIEHQGIGHLAYNSWVHNGSRVNFLNSIKKDTKKREILERNGYTVIETITEDLKQLSKSYFETKFGIIL